MSLADFWRRSIGRKHRSPGSGRRPERSRPGIRLDLQPLEDRRLLSLTLIGPEFRVNTVTAGSQAAPSVAMNAVGDFVVAWYSPDGSDLGIFAQRYNAAGAPQGGEFRVNSFTTGLQRFASVALDAGGDFVIAWESYGQDGSTGGVYAQRYNAAGTPQGGEFRVNTITVGAQSSPSVALDADGDAVITWLGPVEGGSGNGVFAQRYNAAGAPQGSEFRVNTFGTSVALPSVALDADGDFVIAWQNSGLDGSGDGVFAQRYNAAGVPQGGEFRVNTQTDNYQREPSVALDADGDFVVAWDSSSQDGSDAGVYAQAYNAAGAPQGNELRVNTFTGSNQRLPSVAMDADGDAVVAWVSYTQDGSHYGVYAQRLSPVGDPDVSIIDNSDAAGFGVSGVWTPSSGPGVGRNDNVHTAFGESNLPADIASWTFDLSQGPGRYRVSATWFTNTSFSYLFTSAARYEVSDATVGTTRGTTLINQKQFPNDFSDAGSVWEDLGTFDIFGSTLLVRLFSTADNQTQVVADAVRIERVADLPPGPAGREFLVNTFTATQQAFASVGVDSDGDTVIAWQSFTQDGDANGVYAQRYNGAGLPQGVEFRVNTFTASNQETPSVALDADGDFVVTWASWTQDGSGIGVYARRFNTAGTPQGSEFRVNEFTAGNQLAPRVARDAGGNFVITWKSFGQDGSGYGVYARRYNASGAAQGGEFRVNTLTADQQGDPSVAMDADGDFVITWHSYVQDGNGWGIFAQRYNPAGVPQGSEFRVNSSTAGNQLFPSVALDTDGDFVITWQSGDGSLYGIYAQRYNAAGVPQGSEFRVNTFATAEQEAARVSMDAGGGFLVTWMSALADGSLRGIYAQAYNAAGVPRGGEFRVNEFTTGNQLYPSVAVDADGDAVIAWHSYGQDGGGYGVFARRFTPPAEFQVNTFTTNHQIHSSVAADAAGNSVIAWESFGQDGSGYGIYSQRYSAAGGPQGEFRVNTLTSDQQGAPSAAMDADGDFVITWHSLGQDGSGWGIFGQRYNAAGVPQGTEFRVNTFTADNQLYPSVAMDPAGDFVITWQSNGQDGSGYGVYAQAYNAEGAPLGGEFRVNTFTAFSQRLPSVAMDAGGEFVIAWESPQDFHGYGIYAQRFSSAGVPQGSEFRVNTYNIGFQVSASVAMDADGAFVIAWQSAGQDGSGYGIYAQRYSVAGAPLGNEFPVNAFAFGDQRAPAVALDRDGGFLIAWQSAGQDGSGLGVFAQRYNALGALQGSQFRANTVVAGNQADPSVALDADGDAIIAWSSLGQEGSGYGVYAQRLMRVAGVGDPNDQFSESVPVEIGNPVMATILTPSDVDMFSFTVSAFQRLTFDLDVPAGAAGTLNSYLRLFDFNSIPLAFNDNAVGYDPESSDLESFVDFRFITAGTYYIGVSSAGNVTYNPSSGSGDTAGSTVGGHTLTIRLAAAVTPAGPEFRVNTVTSNHQAYASVASDADGAFVVAWESFDQDGSGLGIFAQRYNAGGVPQGSEFRVNTFTAGDQRLPSAAMDANGDFVIAWQSLGQDGSGYGVYAQRYNAAGVPQGTEFRVNTFTADHQDSASVAIDSDGDFVIAWRSFGQDGSSTGVYAQSYNAAGAPQGDEFRANTFTASAQWSPSVALDADGDFVIAWSSDTQDGSGDGVFARRYNAAGAPQGGEFRVNTFTAGHQSNPSVALSAAGDFVIAWTSANQDGSGNGVFAQRYSAAGVPQGGEFRANSLTVNSQWSPSVAMDSDGDFVVVWHSSLSQDGNGYGVFAQQYKAAGVPQGVEVRVNTFTAGNQVFPSVAMDATGELIIAWHSYGQDGSAYGVYAQRYASSDEFRVSAFTTGNQISASLAVDADGDFVIAWTSSGQDGSGSGVYARRYNAAGVSQGGEFRVNTFTTNDQSQPRVAMDADGNFVIAWQSSSQESSYSQGVYAQRYTAAGVPQGGEFRVNTFTTGNQRDPSVAMDAAGGFVITWTSANQDGNSYGVYAQRYNAAGVPQGGEFRANTFTAGLQYDPSVAMDADGDFVIAWTGNGQYGSGAYTQRYNAAGVPQGSEFPVSTSGNTPTSPVVAMDADGDFAIAWHSHYGDGHFNGITAQRYNALGVPQGNQFRVNTFILRDQQFPSIAMNVDGEFLIAWESLEQDGNGWGIYAQAYDAAGAPQGSEFRVNTFTFGSQTSPSAALDADGDAIIAWSSPDGNGTGDGIFARRLPPVADDPDPDDPLSNAVPITIAVPSSGTIAVGSEVDLFSFSAAALQTLAFDIDAPAGGLDSFIRLFDAAGNQLAFNDNAVGTEPELSGGESFLRFQFTTAGTYYVGVSSVGNSAYNPVDGSGATVGSTVGDYTLTVTLSSSMLPAGPEFRVNTVTSGHQAYASVASAAAGNFVIAWESSGQDGSGLGIFAQVYNAAGSPQGAEFGVNTVTVGDQRLPSVAMDDDGDFVVAWQSLGQDGGGWGVYTQRYNAAGMPQGGELRVNTFTTGDQDSSSVAMDAEGDFVIAWRSFGQDGSSTGIYAQRYNAAGVPQSGEFRANSLTASAQSSPSVAMDADGDFLIAWSSDAQDGSGDGVYAQRYNALGAPLGSELRVNTFTAGNQNDPSVAMDVTGDFVISWTSANQDGGGLGVYAQRYNAAGVPQGSELRVNTITVNNQWSPSVAMNADGDFVITWHSAEHQDGSLHGIFAQRYTALGVRQGSEFRVNTFTAGNQIFPSVAMDGEGEFVIAWHSYGQDGGGYGIYAQRYAQGPEFPVNTFTLSSQSAPSVAVNAAGDAIIVWQSYGQDGNSAGIYAQRYNAAGAPQGGEFRVNTFAFGSQNSPSVALDADGDAIIAWTRVDGSGNGIFAQRYNAAGAPQGGEFRVNTFTTNAQSTPSAAMDAAGNFVIAWSSDGQDGSGLGVYAQLFNAAGVPQGNEFRVNTATGLGQSNPSASFDADGDFVIAWQSDGQDGNGLGVFAQRYNAAGMPQGFEFRVNTFSAGNQVLPSVAMDADGDFVVAWQSDGQDGSGLGVYAQAFNAAGVPQGSEFRVNTFTAGNQNDPSVALDADGDFVIAWTSANQDGSGNGVFAQRYNSAGVPQGSEFPVNMFTANDQAAPSVAIDSDGDVIIAWQSNLQDGSNSGIYARRFPHGGNSFANSTAGSSDAISGDSGSAPSSSLPQLRADASQNDAVDAALATAYWNEPDDVALPVGQASRLPEMATAYWNDLDEVVTVMAEDSASRDWDGTDDVAVGCAITRPDIEALELALSDWL